MGRLLLAVHGWDTPWPGHLYGVQPSPPAPRPRWVNPGPGLAVCPGAHARRARRGPAPHPARPRRRPSRRRNGRANGG